MKMKMKMISTLSVISGILLSGSVLAANATDTGTYVPVTYVTQGEKPDGSVPQTVNLNYLLSSFDGTSSKQSAQISYNKPTTLQTQINGDKRLLGVELNSVKEGSTIYQVVNECNAADNDNDNWPAQGIKLVRETLSDGSIFYSCRVYNLKP